MLSLICGPSYNKSFYTLILTFFVLTGCSNSNEPVVDKYLTFYSSKISALLEHAWAQDIESLNGNERIQLVLFNSGNCATCRQDSSLEFTKRVASEPNTITVVIAKYPLDVELLVQQLDLLPEKVLHLPDSIAYDLGLLFPQVVAVKLNGGKVADVVKK